MPRTFLALALALVALAVVLFLAFAFPPTRPVLARLATWSAIGALVVLVVLGQYPRAWRRRAGLALAGLALVGLAACAGLTGAVSTAELAFQGEDVGVQAFLAAGGHGAAAARLKTYYDASHDALLKAEQYHDLGQAALEATQLAITTANLNSAAAIAPPPSVPAAASALTAAAAAP